MRQTNTSESNTIAVGHELLRSKDLLEARILNMPVTNFILTK